MKKIIGVLLFLVMITSVIAQLEFYEGELVKVTPASDNPDVIYSFSEPLNENGEWQTQIGDKGEYKIVVNATYNNKTTTRELTLVINEKEVIETKEVAKKIVREGELVKLDLKATDEDGDELTYTFTEPLSEKGEWQTKEGDKGEYTTEITVSDGKSEITKKLLIVVKEVNNEPVVESFSPNNRTIVSSEREPITFTIKASDPDGDELEYQWIYDEEVVGEGTEFNFTPQFGDAGIHIVDVNIKDKGSIVTHEWNLFIKRTNRAPELYEIKDIFVKEGDLINLNPRANDPDKDKLIISVSGWINDTKYQTSFGDAGVYQVMVKVTDGKLEHSQNITITVSNKDRSPVIEDIPDVVIKEGSDVSFVVKASDPDGDTVGLIADNVPEGAAFINGEFSWSVDYDAVQGRKSWFRNFLRKIRLLKNEKTYPIMLIAKSNNLETRKAIYITVLDVNRKPSIELDPVITIDEGETIVFPKTGSDPDGDALRYYYVGAIESDTFETDFDSAGEYETVVGVTDGEFSDERKIKIEIMDINREPFIEEIKEQYVAENSTIEFDVVASDPDSDNVTVEVVDLPEGASFNNSKFTWTPGFGVVKENYEEFVVKFVASDEDTSFTRNMSIFVQDVNRKPKISYSPKTYITVKKGKPIIFEINATDSDGDDLDYIWQFSLFNKYNATRKMKRTFTKTGIKNVKVTVTDGKDEIVKKWKVKVVNKISKK